MQQQGIRVHREQAEHFAKVWKTPGGIHVNQSPASIQFATDFANIVLYSFIEQAARQAAAAKEKDSAKETAETTDTVVPCNLVGDGC